jgi:hypothetical protein
VVVGLQLVEELLLEVLHLVARRRPHLRRAPALRNRLREQDGTLLVRLLYLGELELCLFLHRCRVDSILYMATQAHAWIVM